MRTAFLIWWVYLHVTADWVTPLTHPPNERKRTTKPVAQFYTASRKHVAHENKKTQALLINTPPHTSRGLYMMIEMDYICMSLYIFRKILHAEPLVMKLSYAYG